MQNYAKLCRKLCKIMHLIVGSQVQMDSFFIILNGNITKKPSKYHHLSTIKIKLFAGCVHETHLNGQKLLLN